VAVAEHTEQRLLEAAGQIFAEKGFRAATINEICTRAEANIAAVNYHFDSKERLYVEAVRHAYKSCADQVPMPTKGN
jgi:AcrR family transcriptional regulator